MTTLIICIDRDNDIGEKAGVESPVVGRQANLQAAISLGLVDPEDSDVNCIFGAVKLYDRYFRKGMDVEVITLAGDIKVGVDSDTRIMEQVQQITQQFNVRDAVLVTDGAEDEGLLTLLGSRISIIGLERITVKQERKIEGIYYYIQKAIEDEKMRRVVVPLGLILMAWGISYFFALEGVMRGFIIFLIGAYLLMKTYHLEGEVNKILSNVMEQITEGKLSWLFSTLSLLLIAVGFFKSIDDLRNSDYYIDHGTSVLEITFILYILIVMNSLIYWIVFSLLCREFGRDLDIAFHLKEDETVMERELGHYFRTPIFLISTGLFLKAGLNIVQVVADSSSIDFSFESTMILIFAGILSFILGRYLYSQDEEAEEIRRERRRHFSPLKRKKKITGWRH